MKQITMTYQKALDRGIVKEGDYFSVKYPSGKKALFRLVKREERYVLWGPPTEGKILLKGKEGYESFLALADAKVREEYFSERVFEEVHALGLSERNYKVHSHEEFCRILDKARRMCKNPEDANMYYFLALRCVAVYSNITYLRVLRVRSGRVYSGILYRSGGYVGSYGYAVRPEATLKPDLRISMKGDGSKENPWIFLSD